MRFLLAISALATSLAALTVPTPGLARGFTLYAQAFLDSTRVPAARVTADVPFKSLVFLKREGWFDSRYEVYLSIDPVDDGGARERTAVMRGHAVARNYEQTSKLDIRSMTSRTFRLEPGTYQVSAALRVRKTNVVLHRSLELVIPDFLATGIGFGSPLVFTVPLGAPTLLSRWSDFEKSAEAGVGVPGEMSLALFDRHPAVRFELFVDGVIGTPVSCELFFEVVSPNDQQVLYGRKTVDLTGQDDAFALSFNVDDWAPGAYRINLRAQTSNPERDASASVEMNVDMTRAMLGRDFDETLEVLSLIGSGDELEGLRKSSEEDRADEWSKFWAARDPDPSTVVNEALVEYLRRVRYVMKAFSDLGPGWRSDRGRVYIRFGPPDRVERTSENRYQGEYLVWRYDGTRRVFVFYDMFGLGDYRLIQGDMF